MSKIYCDVGEIPKGKKRGSMKDCAEQGQIKYYGEKKIDKKTLELAVDKKNSKKKGSQNAEKQLDNLKLKWSEMTGKLKKATRNVDNEEDTKAKKILEKEKVILEKDLEKLKQTMLTLKKKMDISKKIKRTSLNRSKKSSKKQSKKKVSKKKVSKKKISKNKSKKSGGNVLDLFLNNGNKNNKKEDDYVYICD